jgi:organic radical activating enzyme
MPYEDLIKLTDKFIKLGTKAVTTTGAGDPLAYPHLSKYFKYLNDKRIKIGLVTNGVLFNPSDAEFMKMITWCRVSLSDEYKLLTPKLEQIVAGAPIDWSFSYVLTPKSNVYNIASAVKFANKHKFTHVRIVDDILDAQSSDMANLKIELSRLVDDKIVIYQGRKNFTKGHKRCLISLLKPNIGPDGNAYPCCIDGNEPIMIERDGMLMNVFIKDAQIGDKCIPYGEIEAIYKKTKEKLLEISTETGRSMVISKDHLAIVVENIVIEKESNKGYLKTIENFNFVEKKASDLKIGDMVPCKFINKSHEQDTSINGTLAEFLGYFVSEGWLCTKSYKTKSGIKFYYSIGLSPGHNEEFINTIFTCINKLKDELAFDLNYKVYKRRTTTQIMIYSKILNNLIIGYGCGVESLTKSIPYPIFNSPKMIKEIFIKAYFEGDGHFQEVAKNYKGNRISFATASRHLVSDLILLLSELDIYPTVSHTRRAGQKHKIEGRSVNIHDKYDVKISGYYNLEKISEMIGFIPHKGTCIKKRAIAFPKHEDLMFLKIKKIREVDPVDEFLYDIKVKDGNKFCTGIGQIIVHNCGIQYSHEPPSLDFDPEDSMGGIDNIEDIWKNQKYYDGDDCERCYYSDYNNILNTIWDSSELNHKEFI